MLHVCIPGKNTIYPHHVGPGGTNKEGHPAKMASWTREVMSPLLGIHNNILLSFMLLEINKLN